ncbi:MAG: selenium metabolism-associated LysR family transcriptional regulator [Armatimonadetes bacterium]|nr:selenium metabolism-associated LysR family transcriptional regulator [Armatimonadota bacterium]MDW8122584.1 selenium metabolism-associated LysR family transcriptional regulator [Armatimonadota bacterium]
MRKKLEKRLDFWQLEILKVLAENSSFSRTAESLFLSQPTVTNHIAALEKRLGVKLVERTTRRVRLTPAGQLLYRHAKVLLQYERMALQELSNFMGGTEGTLHLGASTIPAHYILPDLLGRFSETTPGIRIVMTVQASKVVIEKVSQGDLDMGIVGQRPETGDFNVFPLWDDEVVLICGIHHPLSQAQSLSVHDLKEVSLVLREEGSGTRATFLQFLNHNNISPKDLTIRAELGSTEAVKKFVTVTTCIAPVSLRAVQLESQQRQVAVLRFKEGRVTRKFYGIVPKDRPETPIARTLRQFLMKTAVSR